MSVKAKLEKHGFNPQVNMFTDDLPFMNHLGKKYPRIFLLGYPEISPEGEMLLSTIANKCLERGLKPSYIHKIPYDVEKNRVYLIPFADEKWDEFFQAVVLKWAYAFVLVCKTTFRGSFLAKDYFLDVRREQCS